MTFTDAQLERYARHIVLREIGGEGQRRLLDARVAVIGAGGIGSPLIQYLAAAGLGHMRVIDDDRVSLSNLQRQTLFATADEGESKAERARGVVRTLNPDIALEAVTERLDPGNARELLDRVDVIVDGSDNFETRLAVSDASLALRTALVSASVAQFEGQLAVYRGWEPGNPCYRCLVGSDPALPQQSCAEVGVLGAMAGVMGSLAALETLRLIVGFGDESVGKLLLVDGLSLRFRTVKVPKDPGCTACAA